MEQATTEPSAIVFACKCLNILIHCNETQKVQTDTIPLQDEERNDAFFKHKDVSRVIVANISKQQSSLIMTRTIGSWTVNFCANCLSDTHAVHNNKEAAYVFVSTNLVEGNTNISELRSVNNYSQVYGMLVEPELLDSVKITVDLEEDFPLPVRRTLAALRQQLSDSLKFELAATEERIRKFTEMQYSMLEIFRDKAHRDYRSLLSLVSSTSKTTSSSENAPEPHKITPQTPPQPAPARRTTRRSESLDTEGLFFLEGAEECAPAPREDHAPHSDLEDTESDDSTSHDEGIHIPRVRAHSMSIAKSLPITIQQNLEPAIRCRQRRPDAVDIAASIKALARSVHGDAVFGDLPPPRFSTQI